MKLNLYSKPAIPGIKKGALIALLMLVGFFKLQAQSVSQYLDRIRDNSAALTAFFSAMPKGGDLHHHYSGSIYTETYINRVIEKDYFVNVYTLKVSKDTVAGKGHGFLRFSALKDTLPKYKQLLMQKWSVKDYNGVSYPSDKQFFETFENFGVTSNDNLKEGLLELKTRAVKENVSYIETMFISIPCNIDLTEIQSYTDQLKEAQAKHDEAAAQQILEKVYNWLKAKDIRSCAKKHNDFVAQLHAEAGIDDDRFTMRYQNYVNRTAQPLSVFKSLVAAFESTNSSKLLVGVNIVAPENNETAMADYWLHMQMYKFCHRQYPKVVYSVHAGELVLGMVQPEELTWHITDAVHTAGAKRIGHGVDIANESNCYDLLQYMHRNKVAVEINLVSNEFILKVKNDRHPISLYRRFKVPIVISTDDAGVLRTNLIEQFVLLAKRYPEISYNEIKKMVFNSIEYSFIEEPSVKQKLKDDLENRFQKFEETIATVGVMGE